MNYKQKIVITIATITLAACFLYVPWRTYVPLDTPQGNIAATHYDYRLFNNPPENPLAIKAPEIIWMYPVQKAGLILIANAIFLFILRTKKGKKGPAFTPEASPQAAF